MKERLVSKYKNNAIASKKKHIFARLLDYFSLFVVTYLLFTVFYAIGNNLPVMKGLTNDLQAVNHQIAEYIDSTHLQRLNSERTALLTIDDGAEQYVKNLCKTSAYVHDIAFPVKNENGIFTDTPVLKEETFVNNADSYELDALSYYFKVFKKNESSLNSYVYDNTDYQSDIDTYLYEKIMKVDSSLFVNNNDEDLLARGNGVSRYVVLTKEKTNTLIKYYKDDRANTSLYDEIFLNFINGAKTGIKDVENNSSSYRALISSFDQTYQSLILGIILIYLIAYTVAYLLLTLILRLISKEWVTIGQKVLGLGVCSSSELESTPLQFIGYHLLNYVLSVTSLLIAFYFMGMFGVLSLKVVGGVSLLAIIVALLILNIISLLMPLFNKHNYDLTTLITRLYYKDSKEFDVPVDLENKTEQKEQTDGRSE